MLNCVYKVTFSKSTFELNEEYDRLSDYEKEKISDLEVDGFFDTDNDKEGYTCYIVTDEIQMRGYLSVLRNNLIQFTCDNLSQDIIKNRINLERELLPDTTTMNSVKYKMFINNLNDWILQNLDMDTVLDRISESGIDSLTNIEKIFLNNFNK